MAIASLGGSHSCWMILFHLNVLMSDHKQSRAGATPLPLGGGRVACFADGVYQFMQV